MTQVNDANIYKHYDQRTHVYEKAGMYIGSETPEMREDWVFDFGTKKMKIANISFVTGCERIFLEILSNSADHVSKTRQALAPAGRIEVIMNEKSISITNYGLPVPLGINAQTGKYAPEMIFGMMLTSSHYATDRTQMIGTNGIGGKAANIFSKKFTVIINNAEARFQDGTTGIQYVQVWEDNMKVCHPPTFTPYKGKTSSIQIIYEMDFARFGYDPSVGYPLEAFELFARHVIDASFTAKVPVTFNNDTYDCSKIRDYAKFYFDENLVKSGVVYYSWPAGAEIEQKRGYQIAKNPYITPLVELLALDTPDEGHHISFVNCMMTKDGGIHVNTAFKAVGDSTVKMINDSIVSKLSKRKKGKEVDAKEKRAYTINIADVKPHISLLLSVKVDAPAFNSQSKTCLTSVAKTNPIKINIEEKDLKPMERWKLMDRLYATIEAKQFASLNKTNGKLGRKGVLDKGVDANLAGSKHRAKCVLYITEGKSGAGYANYLLSLITGKRDYVGVLPMKGKSLNVMNANLLDINGNKEITELKYMLGLCEGVDYTNDYNFSRLNYGGIMIMADSDVDGKHIIGLILNFFYCRFPSLLQRGFITYYRTPIVRVWKGKGKNKKEIAFYTEPQYLEWKNATPGSDKWKSKYYKGLATSTNDDVKKDHANPKVVYCIYDDLAPEAMRLAFCKKLTDNRKKWLTEWKYRADVEEMIYQPISLFINHELILFSLADVKRSIPSLTDGWNEAQRKIIAGAYKHWNIGSSAKQKDYKEYKVAQLAAFVSEKMAYHHGENGLGDVIKHLAQDFIGANNIPWFTQDGQFGSRVEGGKDAGQVRYVFVRPAVLLRYLLRNEDVCIFEYLTDEGIEIEPKTFHPILPTILINGGEGIGTGWSSTVHNYNILDLTTWFKVRLTGGTNYPELLPYYNNFKGTIYVIDRKSKTQTSIITQQNNKIVQNTIEGTIEDTDENLPGETSVEEVEEIEETNCFETNSLTSKQRPLLSMVSYGKYEVDNKGVICVTELPIGRWSLTYRKWLERLQAEKIIKSFRDQSTLDDVYFEIKGFTKTPNYDTLRLKKTSSMSNMVLLDDNYKPVRYDTAVDIMEAFYAYRLPIYDIRKRKMLENLLEKIKKGHDKINFIRAVLNGVIILNNGQKSIIYPIMDSLNLPRELLTSTRTSNLNEDEISDLINTINKDTIEYNTLAATSPEALWLNDIKEFEEVYIRKANKKLKAAK